MTAPLVYLLGWPGVGKLTVARTLAARTGWRVVDNHHINDPIFHVVGADGVTPLPTGTAQLVRQVRAAVYEAMASLAPPHLGFVLTNVLVEHEADHAVFAQVQEIALRRGATFLPVLLRCEEAELRRRITSPARAERIKPRTADVLDRYFAQYNLLVPDHPALLSLDTTHLQPERTADLILRQLVQASGWLPADGSGHAG